MWAGLRRVPCSPVMCELLHIYLEHDGEVNEEGASGWKLDCSVTMETSRLMLEVSNQV